MDHRVKRLERLLDGLEAKKKSSIQSLAAARVMKMNALNEVDELFAVSDRLIDIQRSGAALVREVGELEKRAELLDAKEASLLKDIQRMSALGTGLHRRQKAIRDEIERKSSAEAILEAVTRPKGMRNT